MKVIVHVKTLCEAHFLNKNPLKLCLVWVDRKYLFEVGFKQ